jgi:hypothetical protein
MPNDLLTQRLSDLIDDVDKSFTRSTAAHAVIQENFFVEVFLPIFAGDENPLHAATPEMWMRLAHGPFNEVTVVNPQSEVLFVVPPLYSQSAIKPLDGTGKGSRMPSLSAAVESARMYASQGPNAVHNVIAHELGQRAFMFNVQGMDQDHIARWNAIFARYNRPLLPIKATPNSTPTTHADNIARDSTDIDPL